MEFDLLSVSLSIPKNSADLIKVNVNDEEKVKVTPSREIVCFSVPLAVGVNKIDIESHNLYAVEPKKACKQINTFLKKNSCQSLPITWHNIHFDKAFLKSLFDQGEQKYPFKEDSIDTMRIWRNLQKQELVPSHLRATLGHLANHFDIDYEKAHDALADCHITAQVYHKMLKLQHPQNFKNQINHPISQL